MFCAGLAVAAPAVSEYPARPIRLIVPFPAGGNPDAVARTPAASVAVVHREIVRALQLPKIREYILAGGYEPVGNSPAEFRRFIDTELKRFTDIARSVKISTE